MRLKHKLRHYPWLLALPVVMMAIAAGVAIAQDKPEESEPEPEIVASLYDVSGEWLDHAIRLSNEADALRVRCKEGEDVGFEWLAKINTLLHTYDRAEELVLRRSEYRRTNDKLTTDDIAQYVVNIEWIAGERSRYDMITGRGYWPRCEAPPPTTTTLPPPTTTTS